VAFSAKPDRKSAVYRSCRSFPIFEREAVTWRRFFGTPDADPEVHM